MTPLEAAIQELLMALSMMEACAQAALEASAKVQSLAVIEKAKED